MPTITVSPVPIFNVRVFLIRVEQRVILIDAGIPFTEGRLYQALRNREIDPSQIDSILLTHGHLDHIGCLANLKAISGAAVVCHHSLESILTSGKYEEAIPQAGAWKSLNGPISALLGSGLRKVTPSVVVDDELDLTRFGIPGVMIHTPGHSPGSCSILLEEGICFLGDLLREVSPGKFDTGLFYHDRNQIIDSLMRVSDHDPEIIYLSHGRTMSGEDLRQFLEKEGRF